MESNRNQTNQLRTVRKEDAQRLLEIYRPYVEENVISFEETLPSEAEFQKRIANTIKRYPWLVLEKEGQIVGYAYACSLRSRDAYRWSVEATVYVAEGYHRQGIGKTLYTQLFHILKKQGFANVYIGVVVPNPASENLHKTLGFQLIGTYQNIGFKFQKWHSVSWYQLKLHSKPQPKEPIPYPELEV